MNKNEKKILLDLKLSDTNKKLYLLNKMNSNLFYNNITEEFLEKVVPYFEEYHWACLVLNYTPSIRFIEKYLIFDKENRVDYDFGTLFIIQDVPLDYYIYFQKEVNEYDLWGFMNNNSKFKLLFNNIKDLSFTSIFNILASFIYTNNDEVETKINRVRRNTVNYITSLLELLDNK